MYSPGRVPFLRSLSRAEALIGGRPLEHDWIIVGIAGPTCSGKTALAEYLKQSMECTFVLHQDDFYYPCGSDKLEYMEDLKHYNWDTLSAIDMDRFIETIKMFLKSRTEILNRNVSPVLIVEGTLILNEMRIRNLCRLKYFLTISYEVLKKRRARKKWNIPDPPELLDKCVWPLYCKYRDLLDENGVSFVDSECRDIPTIGEEILREIREIQGILSSS